MKKFALALSGLALLAVTPALADNTDTKNVSVTGTIVSALTLTTTDAVLPQIVKPKTTLANGLGAPSAGTSTLALTCSAAGAAILAYGPGANPFANGSSSAATISSSSTNATSAPAATATCAKLTTAGQTGYSFLTTVGTVSSLAVTGVTVALSCPTASTVVGTDLYCGASVGVTTAASTGAYAATFPVTVTYD